MKLIGKFKVQNFSILSLSILATAITACKELPITPTEDSNELGTPICTDNCESSNSSNSSNQNSENNSSTDSQTGSSGSTTEPVQYSTYYVYTNKSKNLKVTEKLENQNVDLLFTIDNSGSMAEEQRYLSTAFPKLFDNIQDLNWQIAITTTDVSNSREGNQGSLKAFSSTTVDKLHILKSTSTLSKEQNEALFAANIKAGTSGSGSEQPIKAIFQSIDKSINNILKPNLEFFRAESSLQIIIITDEDESANTDSNNANVLISKIKSTFGENKKFNIHTIAILPNDAECLRTARGTYGNKVTALADLTKGTKSSICLTNWDSTLANIGKKIRDSVKSVDLDCEIADSNRDGLLDIEVIRSHDGVESEISFQYLKENKQIIFETDLDVGDYKVNYVCQERMRSDYIEDPLTN